MKSDISENVVLFDWVTVTFKTETEPRIWVKLLGMDSITWDEMEHGRNGYRKGLFYGSISILYDGNPGMGICLDMSGQGCRTFETDGSGDFDELFRLIRDNSEVFNITRLDVAFDDHTGILDIQQLFWDTHHQEFVSKFRQSEVQEKFSDGRPGITVYHGSKKSSVLFRIYDKAAERGLPPEQHWVRVEMQLRDERAFAFIGETDAIGVLFRGVLFNYVRYVESCISDSNRWRWPMKDYWSNLIDSVGAIKLYVKPGSEYNLEQLERFVFSQAGNAVSAAMQIYGPDVFRDKLQKRGTSDNPKYRRLVDTYRYIRHGSAIPEKEVKDEGCTEVCAALRAECKVYR